MKEFERQSSKKRIEIQVGDQIYSLKNPYREGPYELGDKLADQIERKQFDPNLQQGLAWKHLETGTHTQDDIIWIKHECAERYHELTGYNEVHNRAQIRFDGAPWENQF